MWSFDLQEADAVCLADFCEIFRCDVVSGAARATFWDVALCMEEDMKDLTQDCIVRVNHFNFNLGKLSRGQIDDIFFSQKIDWYSRQIFSIGDNLHWCHILFFGKNKKYFKILSAEMFTQYAKIFPNSNK